MLVAAAAVAANQASAQQHVEDGVTDGSVPRQPHDNNYWKGARLATTESKVLNFVEFFIEADLPALLTFAGLFALTLSLAMTLPTVVAFWLKVPGVPERIARGFSMLTFIAIVVLGGAVSLSVFDLDKSTLVLNLNLFGIALSSGLGVQISNLFSGLLLPMTSRVGVGDTVIVNASGELVRGRVEEVGLFNTYIRSVPDGAATDSDAYQMVEVPNHVFSNYACRRLIAGGAEPYPSTMPPDPLAPAADLTYFPRTVASTTKKST